MEICTNYRVIEIGYMSATVHLLNLYQELNYLSDSSKKYILYNISYSLLNEMAMLHQVAKLVYSYKRMPVNIYNFSSSL